MPWQWKVKLKHVLALPLVVTAISLLVPSSFRAAIGQSRPIGQTNQLRELAERLLSPLYSNPLGQQPSIQLLVGQLPSNLPLKLSIPPGATLLGSSVRSQGDQKLAGADIVLDVPGSPEAILNRYDKELQAQNWKAQRNFPGDPMPGGFQPAPVLLNRVFCKSTQGPLAVVSVEPQSAGPNHVRLSIDTLGSSSCAYSPSPYPGSDPAAQRIPPLYAPKGTTVQSTGGGGGGDRWSTEAVAETNLGAVQLEEHFAQQLKQAGWQQTASGENPSLAWSTWTLPGEGEWQGFLYALRPPGAKQVSLHVQVQSAAARLGY